MDVELLQSWLDLPSADWPPDHYTLLGLPRGVGSADDVHQLVYDRTVLVKAYQHRYPDEATAALNLLARALDCLTDTFSRRRYDAELSSPPADEINQVELRLGTPGGDGTFGGFLTSEAAQDEVADSIIASAGQPGTSGASIEPAPTNVSSELLQPPVKRRCPNCGWGVTIRDRRVLDQVIECTKCKYRFGGKDEPKLAEQKNVDSINDAYAQAMSMAKSAFYGERFSGAVNAYLAALRIRPNDPAATAGLAAAREALNRPKGNDGLLAEPDRPAVVEFEEEPELDPLMPASPPARVESPIRDQPDIVLRAPLPKEKRKKGQRDDAFEFAIPFGLALQGLGLSRIKVSLLPEEYRPGWFGRLKEKWKGPPAAAWGIEVGTTALRAVRMERTRMGVKVTDQVALEHSAILSRPDVDAEAIKRETLEKFADRHDFEDERVVAALNSYGALARFVKLPPVEEKKISHIIRFEAIQQIPFRLEEVVWDWCPVSAAPPIDGFAVDVECGIFAVKRDVAKKCVEPLLDAGIPVNELQITSNAICNLMQYELFPNGPVETAGNKQAHCVAVLDIGTDSSMFVIVDGGRIIWSRIMPIGGNHFTRALAKEMKLTFQAAEQLKRNTAKSPEIVRILKSIKPVLADFVGEVQRSLGYFGNIHRPSQVEYLLALGNGFRLPGLQAFLKDKTGLEVRKPFAFDRLGQG